MKIRDRLCRTRKSRHFCNQNSGFSFFFRCVKSLDCGVDWKTETSVCGECGTLLRPPKWLLAYNHFGGGWQGLFAFVLTAILTEMSDMTFPRNALLDVLAYVTFGHLIPAALAAFGTWESFALPGLSLAETLEKQHTTIEKRKQMPYHRTVRYSLAIILLILFAFANKLAD